ncbi:MULTISPECIES: integrase core domain-containing protein [Sphingomonas]
MPEPALVHEPRRRRRKCEAWRRDYNEMRPHSDIGNKVPIRR